MVSISGKRRPGGPEPNVRERPVTGTQQVLR